MKKILLTGCAGFIGSNFLKKIAVPEEQTQFIVLDALTYAGHYPTIKDDIESNDHLSFVHLDIRNKEDIDVLFKKKNSMESFILQQRVMLITQSKILISLLKRMCWVH